MVLTPDLVAGALIDSPQAMADLVHENKRVAVFSWITGLFFASHVLGNVLIINAIQEGHGGSIDAVYVQF
ncbi:hypothetical protein Pyn_01502 [Prunus yedoensis var. nudiflora]|uniref:Uncharacterized protein n=1 Tax=Prunus yedoensis var. nudiflora TaxID=2094558 RepID=A0A314U9I9_PRUYE|nr:hypothetical protein Pyn_01502 [Prunus yedoensis var. nudiflora]